MLKLSRPREKSSALYCIFARKWPFDLVVILILINGGAKSLLVPVVIDIDVVVTNDSSLYSRQYIQYDGSKDDLD